MKRKFPSTPAQGRSASSRPSASPEPTRTSTRGPTRRENSACGLISANAQPEPVLLPSPVHPRRRQGARRRSSGLGVDFRDLENRVRHLARATRWFIQWARTQRAGTRRASHANAVWWLWEKVAGGHPIASPARTTPARARKFASSLASAQVRTLSAAASVPTNRYEEDPR